MAGMDHEPLLHAVVQNGSLAVTLPDVAEAAAYAATRLDKLPDEHKRFENPHTYKVGVSKALLDLRSALYNDLRARAGLS